MKKVIVTLLVTLIILSCFTGCKKNEAQDGHMDKVVDISPVTDTQETSRQDVIDFETTRPKEEPSTIKPEKKMKVNVPWSFIQNEAGGDVNKYAATHGYDIKREKDGSATMTMDGLTYSLLLSKVGMNTIMAFGDIVDSGDYPYTVKLADYSEDFDYLLMQVDTSLYKKYKDTCSYEDLAYLLGQIGLYYQMFTVEEDDKCEVILASAKTGKVVYSKTYTY